jgi:glycosyltransferase involved in cell wall biosynthesis
MPRVSVLMAVYNGEAHLGSAIGSILDQTFTDFEFLIVDDGSTDNTPAILAKWAQEDVRIRVFSQPNQGLTVSLNRLMDSASGEYLARMDADDLSLFNRFERQVNFLDAHPEIGVCGAAVVIGTDEGRKWEFESDPVKIRCNMLFQPPVGHPVVMLRKSVFDAHGLRYNPAYRLAQDYDLWMRASDVTNITNLPDILLQYRVTALHASTKHRAEQLATTERIQIARFRQMGIDPTPAELETHRMLFTWQFAHRCESVQRLDAWLRKIHQANRNSRLYPEPAFSQGLAERWYRICRSCAPLGISTGWRYLASPLSRYLPLKSSVRLLARCLLRRAP